MKTLRTMILGGLCLAVQGCDNNSHNGTGDAPGNDDGLHAQIASIMERNDVLTAGVALITNAEVAWTGYFGEQAPGVRASAMTQFNVGSITKTVAAEAVLRLVQAGKFELDAPMAPTWIDPDLIDDPRHELLTPRIALTHTTGFPNWRFFTAEGKLKFQSDPGTTFTYSGEGFEYLATFAEKQTGQTFADLVQGYVFDPMGITDAAYRIEESNYANIAQTRDAKGEFPGHYCYPENSYCRSPGSSTPADDLVITVEDYAKFVISVMKAEGYGPEIAAERDSVQSTKGAHAVVDCGQASSTTCPKTQGYGLGWEVLDYGSHKILAHGGSDWHELAVAYFDSATHDGVIIFLNAPNDRALATMPEALAILDPDSPMIGMYRRWLGAADQQN